MKMIDRAAIFADGTKDYRTPDAPEAYSEMILRLRTGCEESLRVFLCYDNQRRIMNLAECVNGFRYYEISISVLDKEILFYFELETEDDHCFYQENCVSDIPRQERFFRIMPGFDVPAWARGAVMYQILTDRFCNGDSSNDVKTDEYYYTFAHSSHVDMWSRYPSMSHVGEFYGGDLAGVIKKLDYLKDLGVEVLYFNPLFVSPSYHKYDTQDYDYIDPHFGVVVEDNGELLAEDETDNRKATCYINRVTKRDNLEASNQLFIKLVEEAHQRGIKIILDGVFNHCGSFHKWLDREKIYHGQPSYEPGAYCSRESPYRDFFKFYCDKWPDNGNYDGWWGFDTLPKLNYEGSRQLKEEIFRIARKWISPPYNADGWRLDVAADLGNSEEFNHQFWREFRDVVKKANPNALILAEHYGNPQKWLRGDQWDSVMNYDAFMEPVSFFLTGMEKHSDEYHEELCGNVAYFKETMMENMSKFMAPSLQCSMNQLSNHDHSRFLTRTNQKVGRVQHLGYKAASDDVRPEIMVEAMIIQMTWPGAPTIYYGDEAGVCGFTDPDNRRTFPWGKENKHIFENYKQAIALHHSYEVLRTGSFCFLNCNANFLGYARFNRIEQIIVVFNHSKKRHSERISLKEAGIATDVSLMQVLYVSEGMISHTGIRYFCEGGILDISIPPQSVVVLHHQNE